MIQRTTEYDLIEVPKQLEHTVRKYFYHQDSSLDSHMVQVRIGGRPVCYVCLEILGTTAVIHLGMIPEAKTREILSQFPALYTQTLVPYMKSIGVTLVTSTCAIDDKGTRRMLCDIGLNPKEIVIGTHIL